LTSAQAQHENARDRVLPVVQVWFSFQLAVYYPADNSSLLSLLKRKTDFETFSFVYFVLLNHGGTVALRFTKSPCYLCVPVSLCFKKLNRELTAQECDATEAK